MKLSACCIIMKSSFLASVSRSGCRVFPRIAGLGPSRAGYESPMTPVVGYYCCSSIGTASSPLRFSSTRLFSSFQPSPPPGTHGTPVFPDIDFSTKEDPDSESTKRNSDPNAIFVVTGASRGIGLQFVKSLLERTQGKIVACVRSPDKVDHLDSVIQSLPDPTRVMKIQLDVEDQASIESAGEKIRESFDRVDLLLNVAGILGDGKNDPGPERSISKINRDWFEKTLAVNLVGPVMLTKELSPLMLQRRRGKSDSDAKARPVAVVANLSARVGSISDNALGGWYTYRMSKTALNQATRTMALELKRSSTWSISLHPGTTKTDLSKPFQANVAEGKLFPVDFTVNSLLNVIDSMKEEHSGGFFDWAGKSISF